MEALKQGLTRRAQPIADLTRCLSPFLPVLALCGKAEALAPTETKAFPFLPFRWRSLQPSAYFGTWSHLWQVY